MTTQAHPKLPSTSGRSVELTTFQTVTSSPSNRKFSFGTQSRFPKLNLQGTDELCYEAIPTTSKRATGLGVGERFKGTAYQKEKRPSPVSYHIPSLFNPDQTISSFSNTTSFQKDLILSGQD